MKKKWLGPAFVIFMLVVGWFLAISWFVSSADGQRDWDQDSPTQWATPVVGGHYERHR